MKITLYILLAFASLHGLSMVPPDTVWNQTDERGMKQGHWKKHYPNGELMYKGYFRDNKPEGKMLRYYEDGLLQAELYFPEDSDVTYSTMYFKNGQAGAEGKYIRQQRDSIWSYYSYYTGALSYRESYSMGKKEGLSVKYYPEGIPAEMIFWSGDMKNGTWKQYFEDSTLRLSSAYLADLLEGPFRVYNRNKVLKIDGTYSKGKMTGDWHFYDNEGKLMRTLKYEDGELLNKEEKEKWAKEFMDNVEKDLGKIPEPDLNNFFERKP
jgi:antitoxin component YwqK of YwqJK toxin-antitoxin module